MLLSKYKYIAASQGVTKADLFIWWSMKQNINTSPYHRNTRTNKLIYKKVDTLCINVSTQKDVVAVYQCGDIDLVWDMKIKSNTVHILKLSNNVCEFAFDICWHPFNSVNCS